MHAHQSQRSVQSQTPSRRLQRRRMVALLIALVLLATSGGGVQAFSASGRQVEQLDGLVPTRDEQFPRSFRIPRVQLEDADNAGQNPEGGDITAAAIKPIIVDTDAGVDDAAAIVWLLTQTKYPVNVRGFTTVAGNTTVANATNNVLTLLDANALNRADIPVVMGAAAPLTQSLSLTGILIHGPDGLWFQGWSNPPLTTSNLIIPTGPALCDPALNLAGATLIALGPLTNVAQAIASCPTKVTSLAEIVILGGAKFGGNASPVAEFNFWQDPNAAHQVLTFAAPPYFGAPPNVKATLVLLDAFSQFMLFKIEINILKNFGTTAARFIAVALGSYICVQNNLLPDCLTTGAPNIQGTVPDVVAAIHALNTAFSTSQSALVKVIRPDSALTVGEIGLSQAQLTRGLSVIGLTFAERITMIANDLELSNLAVGVFNPLCLPTPPPPFTNPFECTIGLILAREPDNASVVVDINQKEMQKLFMKELLISQAAAASVDASVELSDNQNRLFLPIISSD